MGPRTPFRRSAGGAALESDGFESRWGPEGFRVEVHALEPKENGLLHYTMIADSPEMTEAMKRRGQPTSHAVRARFSAFSPQKTPTITSIIDFLPGVEAYESHIEVVFTPLAHGAHMAVTLHAMHDPHFTEMQRAGFTSQLGELDRRYTKQGFPRGTLPGSGASSRAKGRPWPAPAGSAIS